MFDIGFSELLLICVVTLLVLGPERLPKVARMAGSWLGRMNRQFSEIKQEVVREIDLDEFRRLQQEMHENAVKSMGLVKESAQLAEHEADHLSTMMRGLIVADPNDNIPRPAEPGSDGKAPIAASRSQVTGTIAATAAFRD